MKIRYLLAAGTLAALVAAPALADLTYTQGSGTTIFDFVCFTTKHCSAHTTINSAGTEVGTTSNPFIIDTPSTGNLQTTLGTGVGTPGSSSPSTNINIGCNAATSEQTARTNGQNSNAACDAVGKQIFLPYANPENTLKGLITTAMTGTTDTILTGMDLQGAGVRVYITGCVISNSHATVGTDVVLKDGSGGSVLWTFPAAPAYGGTSFSFPTPIKSTANTGVYAANITTGSNTKVSCTGYKGA